MSWNKNDNGLDGPSRSKRNTKINADRIKRDVIVVGASAGGVQTLMRLFSTFPSDMPAIIGVVLHRSTSPGELAYVLGRNSALPVVEPGRNTSLKPGHIYLAPPDHHLLFEKNGLIVQRGPKEHATRPAVDPLFRSAASTYEQRAVGVLLTGCGEDGVSGLLHISNEGGITLAQDPDEAYMPYMPLNALRFDDVASTYPIDEMGPVLVALANGKAIVRNHQKS